MTPRRIRHLRTAVRAPILDITLHHPTDLAVAEEVVKYIKKRLHVRAVVHNDQMSIAGVAS